MSFASRCAVLLLAFTTLRAVSQTTAWKDGRLHVDVPGVIGRSDVVLGRPNAEPLQALPLGNGRLGVALWSQDGLTAQLNRADTLPYRYSPAQVVLPGVAALTTAADYEGRLRLHAGAFEEHGGGMRLTAYVQPHADTLVIEVSGADPGRPQTALLRLWEPRRPVASVAGAMGMLAESWLDDKNPGASGRRFGSLAAIAAEGRDVSVAVTDARTITLTVTPNPDGRFRILVAAPKYNGEAEAPALASHALADRDPTEHLAWWSAFWQRAGLIKLTSADGTGEYLENLRNLYLFSSAAENGGELPGSQAGVGDLFSSARDEHQWDPSAFWHWNLRMQVAANLGAGLPELNEPYFRLYGENLASMEQWTRERMQGAPGICIPETMRFNGKGIEFETWGGNTSKVSGWNCDAASGPYYNARTLSTGAEVSLWIWQQYLATGDKAFLRANLPVMIASARFLLSYEKPGADGLLHTERSNAHETQWDVTDPTTDLAARRALYGATIEAARLLQVEPALVAQMKAVLAKIPAYPRVSVDAPKLLLAPGDDGGGKDAIAPSYQPAAAIHNVENIGLEPVWPYNLIGEASPLFELAKRTYLARPNKGGIDWSSDPVQAARLGLGEEVRSMLLDITQANQRYINGFARWGGNGHEFYVEQIAMVALALQESLVQDYDGVIRIAPAVPKTWDYDGSVAVRNGARVDVQVRHGEVATVGFKIAHNETLKVKNPWPGERVRVLNTRSGAVVAATSAGTQLTFAVRAGNSYLLERAATPGAKPFAPIDGKPATSCRRLGAVQIGLGPAGIP